MSQWAEAYEEEPEWVRDRFTSDRAVQVCSEFADEPDPSILRLFDVQERGMFGLAAKQGAASC